MTTTERIQRVFDAPRGQRFTRPAYTAPLTREQRLLAQMRDNPRVAYRQEHGILPAWMDEPPKRPGPAAPLAPQPRTAPDDGPPHHMRPSTAPRPERPPLPRRPRRHRKPPRRSTWTLTGYALAALAGAFAHHLTATLL
jgi:hypothetical protein